MHLGGERGTLATCEWLDCFGGAVCRVGRCASTHSSTVAVLRKVLRSTASVIAKRQQQLLYVKTRQFEGSQKMMYSVVFVRFRPFAFDSHSDTLYL